MDKILEYIKENFVKKTAFVCGIIVLVSFFAAIDSFIEKFIPITGYRAIIYIIICLAWLIIWIYKRKYLPKNKNGCVGLIIGIETENDKQKNRIKNDFIAKIKELIAQKGLNTSINVILLNNYQAEIVSKVLEEYGKNKQNKELDRNWQKIRKRTAGHFFIYGGIKERQDVENKYLLNLDALVVHAPVPPSTQKQIFLDLISVWYKEISIQEKVEFKGFIFAAETIFIAVQYIVGIAALVSGDIALAIELHTALDSDKYFSRIKTLPANLQNVKKRLKVILAEENYLMAKYYSNLGKYSEAEKYTSSSLSIEPNYAAYLLKSIIEFSYKNNPSEALKYVYLAKEIACGDGTWRYNEGFLLMFMERFDEALKIYNKIGDTTFINEERVLIDIINFNKEIVQKYPSKIQSYYIIGFLKFKKEANYPEALEYFEKYISESEADNKNRSMSEKAKEYLIEIKKIMNI